jgi:hypothetical protein
MRDLATLDLTEDEVFRLFALFLGFVLGAVLIVAARDLLGELVEAQDQAARRRMRDLFAELLQAREAQGGAELSQTEPAADLGAAISTRTGPRLIAVNENREAATDASDAGTDVKPD